MHSCRHCGAVYERRHLESYAATPPGKEQYVCGRCGRSFARRDALKRYHCNERSRSGEEHHVCERCVRSFTRRDNLKRHHCNSRQVLPPTDEPPSPKRSRQEEIPPFVEDSVLPPSRLPFSGDLSNDLQDVVHEHIRTSVARGPVQTRYNH